MIPIAHFIAISCYIGAAAIGASVCPPCSRASRGGDRTPRRGRCSALRRIGSLSPDQAEGVEILSRALMNKFLHEASARVRAAAANGRGLGVVDVARYLFALESISTLSADTRGESD